MRLRIVAHDGQPQSGAFVIVEVAPTPFPELALVADSLGAVTLHLEPGYYRFRSHGRDGTVATTELEMTDADREAVMTAQSP